MFDLLLSMCMVMSRKIFSSGIIKSAIITMLSMMLIFIFSLSIVSGDSRWQKDSNGWWYKDYDGTSPGYASRSWRAIGNKWYYFNSSGYVLGSHGLHDHLNGMDISEWQGTIDWKKVKNSYIDFAFIRMGYGITGSKSNKYTTMLDNKYKRNISEANKYGVPAGVYWYSYAVTPGQSRQDARFVISQLKGYKISYPVVIDIEDSCQDHLTKKELTALTKAFTDEIKKAGYTPMVYANENFYRNRLNFNDLPGVEKWIAAWGYEKTSSIPREVWQCCSTGRVPGIAGNVDINFGYKNYAKSSKHGWQKNSNGWWYERTDGSWPANKIESINGEKYFFDKDGYMETGWCYEKSTGKWYFAGSSGALKTGWEKASDKWYYLLSNGQMKTGWKYDNYYAGWFYFDVDGSMQTGKIKISNKWYYLLDSGKMKTGWCHEKSTGKWYLADSKGVLHTGWEKVNNEWYYLLPNHQMKTGWKYDNYYAGWFYFNTDGSMKKGWLKDNSNKWYYLLDSGKMKIGWLQDSVSGKWYYLNSNGEMLKGKIKLTSESYYLDDSGAMKVGWGKNYNTGKWYYAKDNGALCKGWIKTGGKWYYIDSNFEMVTGSVDIDGRRSNFNGSGEWVGYI